MDSVLHLESYFDAVRPGVLPSVHFRRITTREVANVLQCRKSTAMGPDDIAAMMLRLLLASALTLPSIILGVVGKVLSSTSP